MRGSPAPCYWKEKGRTNREEKGGESLTKILECSPAHFPETPTASQREREKEGERDAHTHTHRERESERERQDRQADTHTHTHTHTRPCWR